MIKRGRHRFEHEENTCKRKCHTSTLPQYEMKNYNLTEFIPFLSACYKDTTHFGSHAANDSQLRHQQNQNSHATMQVQTR